MKITSHLLHISTSLDSNLDLITTRKLFSWVSLSLLFICKKPKMKNIGLMKQAGICSVYKKEQKSPQNLLYSGPPSASLTHPIATVFPVLCVCQLGRTHCYHPQISPNQTIFNKLPVQISSDLPRQSTTWYWTNKLKGKIVHKYSVHMFSLIVLFQSSH